MILRSSIFKANEREMQCPSKFGNLFKGLDNEENTLNIPLYDREINKGMDKE